MTTHTSNPQPQAVERINKKKSEDNPSNLNGNEMEKKPQEKEEMVKVRNKNNSKNETWSNSG